MNPRSAQAFHAKAQRLGIAPPDLEHFVPQTISSRLLFTATALIGQRGSV
jgi:hypothetical protein